ncbi:hypothetical protein [Streptomyces sp. ST1015]|uniref:hypothetical protein n=1 Tax=unclassified Streptomyces TaxID=2593676 RepID=UPI001CA6727C|nr:hypothetical protein [Streptomyces sp. ST1015]QZZ28259.1 hypothetical protein A7X85_20070 [Streptomyces sp. ST1015]
MERELEELAVRAAGVLGAAMDAENEVRAEAWRETRSWFIAVSASGDGGRTMFHLFWEGAFSFRARHILESLVLAEDPAAAADLLRELVARYEADADPTPSDTAGTPTRFELTNTSAATPPASPDRADRVTTLTSMLVGAKLEQPTPEPPADPHHPPTPGPEEAPRADHPRNGHRPARTPEPEGASFSDSPKNGHRPTRTPEPEAPPPARLPVSPPFDLPAPASPDVRSQEHAPSLSAPADAHPTPPHAYDPPPLVPKDAPYPAPSDPGPTPPRQDPAAPAPTSPPRDHVDFSRSTFHGPVTGAVAGNVYFNHPGPTPTHLDPTTWPTLADLTDADALDLGVREARRLEEGPELPLYVVRDVETSRDWFADGRLLVITGRRFAGKTRTAWEVLSELPPDTRVFAPSPGTDLRPLPALLAGHPGRHVLWLDDLDAHLRERQLDIQLLAELTRARVQVVGTMNDDVYDAYMDETDGPAHRLLARARKERLSTVWSDTELARARDSEDPRLTEALEWRGDTGVTQYLAVAPLLVDTWVRTLRARSRRGARETLLLASVDLARCGVRRGMPRDLLAAAQTAYDPVPPYPAAAVDEALAWASERRHGVTGFLLPGEREGTWRPHGALVAAALREERWLPVGVWRAALEDTSYDAEDRHTVHINARTLFTPKAEKGDRDAMHMLGLLKETEGDEVGAMYWYRKAADAGSLELAERVGAYLLRRRRAEQAVPYLRTAADKNPTPTAHRLLAEAHLALADRSLRRATETGDGNAAAQLGALELRLGDASRAAQYYARKEEDVPLARNLAAYHLLRGETETAQPYLERAAHDGDDRAVRILDDIRAAPQTLQDAESYFRGSTDPQDLAHLGVVLERSGRSTEALQAYDEAAARGDAFARDRAEALRRKRDTVDG